MLKVMHLFKHETVVALDMGKQQQQANSPQAKVKAVMQHKAQRLYVKCCKGMMRLSKADEHAPSRPRRRRAHIAVCR